MATQYKGELRTSEEALRLISGYENCTLNAYKCQAGKWTNGIGNTHGVNPNELISLDTVAENFVANVKEAVSFTMNAGCGNYRSSTYSKTGNCSTLLAWNKYTDPTTKKKVVSKGLDNRRKAEYALCVKN